MKKSNIWGLLLVVAFIHPPNVHAAFIFQDNFNMEHNGIAFFETCNYSQFANWNVNSKYPNTDGSVDLIGNGFFDVCPGNGLYLDMSGSTTSNGILSTKTEFAPGTYVLSFNLSPNPANVTNVMYVSLGDWNVTINCSGGYNGIYKSYSYPIITTQVGFLSFYDEAGTNTAGAVLDNVALESVTPTLPASVPLPGTLLILGSGLAGLIGLSRTKYNIVD
jgi:hypothetical protein